MNLKSEPTAGASHCCLCGGGSLQSESPGYSSCRDCGAISQSPPPASIQFQESVRYEHQVQPSELRWLQLVEEQNPPARTLIDLGAGDGGFVEAASLRGWEASGLEGSPEVVASARAAGRPIVHQDLDAWMHTGPRAGVVRLWFVLEHVRRPGHILEQARAALLPGGLLLVAVPNDANWLSRRVMRDDNDCFWEHPLHLHHFPPYGLEDLLKARGFELVIAEAGRPTELMRGGNLPLHETWERIRALDPSLSRLFYQLGVGRSRELLLRLRG